MTLVPADQSEVFFSSFLFLHYLKKKKKACLKGLHRQLWHMLLLIPVCKETTSIRLYMLMLYHSRKVAVGHLDISDNPNRH